MIYEMINTFVQTHWLLIAIVSIYIVTTIVILGIIISENRNPVKSLAWVTVLIVVPVLGIVLYIFFGQSFKNKRMITRRNRKKLKRMEHHRPVEVSKLEFRKSTKQEIRLARSLVDAYYYEGNNVEIFTTGKEKFERLFEDIEKARNSICIQYYIFEGDSIGNSLADLLIKKAKEGVKIRLIYDHVGSLHVKRHFFRRMQQAGIQAYPFFRVNFPLLAYRINWRNHRKLVIIDGHTGYVGGMNVADRYIDGGKFESWRDTHLRITGPGVVSLIYSFAVDWNFMGQPLDDITRMEPKGYTGNIGLQFITSGPTNQWSNIELMFHKAIASATDRVFIQTPYFLPTEALLKALETAALANVDVRIMLPYETDSAILRYASFSYIAECLRAGIKIYLYRPGMLHSKVIIVDDEITSIGSTNFDFRSFEHNFEGNIFLYSREFNEQAVKMFLNDQLSSTRVVASEWKKRPKLRQWAESTWRLLSPVL